MSLLTPKTMKLPESTANKITEDKNSEYVAYLEITKEVLVHCNNVNNDYQQNSWILHTFVPNKRFCKLLEITPTNFIFLKTFNSEFQTIEGWFTCQNCQPLEIEYRVSLTLVTK